MPNNRTIRPSVEDTIYHYTLKGVLPEGYTVSLSRDVHVLSVMRVENDLPKLVSQCVFTEGEYHLAKVILDSFPDYCPFEVMHSVHMYGENITERTVEQSRIAIENASDDGVFDDEMRPVRTLVSRIRSKTDPMNIRVVSMLKTGYLITYKSSQPKEIKIRILEREEYDA